MSRLLKIIRLFCKRALQKKRYSAKETCIFEEPTSRSHPRLRSYANVNEMLARSVCVRVCIFVYIYIPHSFMCMRVSMCIYTCIDVSANVYFSF